jgi:hypothetical protein
VFLDSPLPENLPVVGACSSCNNGFSQDEAYLACLIESVIAGSPDPARIRRPRVANILRRTPALRAKIEAARTIKDGRTVFNIESDRSRNVLLKLARGHAAFELSQVCREEPAALWWRPLPLMTEEERDSFDAVHVAKIFGEVGSRGLQRLLVTQVRLEPIDGGESKTSNLLFIDWVNVQEDRYRYLAIDDEDGITIKIIIAEYLACEVRWTF